MDRRFLNATSTLAAAALKLCAVLANYWRTALYDQEYRPELHYMRGPGPRCRSRRCASARNAIGELVSRAGRPEKVSLRLASAAVQE
jgi:hypothetical protein